MAYQLNMFGDTTRDERERTSLPRRRGGRVVSLNELERIYKPWGTGLVKCVHARSYFVECTKCKRTRSEADDNFERFKAHTHL